MESSCFICRKIYEKPFFNKDQFSGEWFQVYTCSVCGMAVTDFPSRQDLAQYYPQKYYGEQNLRFSFGFELLIKFFRFRRAAIIHKIAGRKSGCILDVGCGRGFMLDALKKIGWECLGVEYSLQSSKYARDVLHLQVKILPEFSSLPYPDHQFDVVSFWHVLEHMGNPLDVLRESCRILKSGGFLVLEVPNFSSWQARLNREKWIYLEAPRHLYHFSVQALQQLLEKQGFHIKRISTGSLEMGVFGMLQTLLNFVQLEPNFLYVVIRNPGSRPANIARESYLINMVILTLFILPCFVITLILEFMAVCFGRGGVIRVIAQK